MKIAFMFPGQGSQTQGMGKDLYEAYPEYRKTMDKISEITGKDMAKLCFETQIEELSKTENTQLAIASMSLGILSVLKQNDIEAQIAVGLSLGEYPALIYGGYLSLEDGMTLLKHRGKFMGSKLPEGSYLMAAVIGLESKVIEEVCKDLQNQGHFCVPANYNYSGQTVLSGSEEAIEKATVMLKEKGAKKVVTLKTSGPFHTKKLEQAKVAYEDELEKITFLKGDKKVIKNLDGTFYQEEDPFKEILANHIVSPVRFDKAISQMKNQGIDTFVEVGPGKALSGFIKKELGNEEIQVLAISNVETFENAVTILKGENKDGE